MVFVPETNDSELRNENPIRLSRLLNQQLDTIIADSRYVEIDNP